MKGKLHEYAAALASLAEIEERLADRGPIKVIPRTDAPNIPILTAKRDALLQALRVRRNYKVPKGHDLAANGSATNGAGLPIYDLHAIGTVEEIRAIKAGQDSALPKSTTIIRVVFQSGDHLWFAPEDLEPVK